MIHVPAAIVQRIDTAIAAINADDARRLQRSFAPNVTIVDPIGGFVWRGPDAVPAWWAQEHREEARGHLGLLRVRLTNLHSYATDARGADAYVVVRLHLWYSGVPGAGDGNWVLTLHRTGRAWKITTSTFDPIS